MATTIADNGRIKGRDPYADQRSLVFRLRMRRYRWLRELIDRVLGLKGRCRILDLGGSDMYWDIAGPHIDNPDITVDLVNLHQLSLCARRPNFRELIGDARDLDVLDGSYDLVHSNSLLEHVGSWDDMRAVAATVRRVAPAYFIQTPYFWFPVEPHYRTPFIHWLPGSWQYRLVMARRLGFMRKAATISDAMATVDGIRLLDARQMGELFPDAEIRHERLLGLTKSLVAVRA